MSEGGYFVSLCVATTVWLHIGIHTLQIRNIVNKYNQRKNLSFIEILTFLAIYTKQKKNLFFFFDIHMIYRQRL